MTIEETITKLTTPHEITFWGEVDANFTATLVERVFGDGQRLLYFVPVDTRPHYYLVRVDTIEPDDEGEREFIAEHIVPAIEEEFGVHAENEDDYPALALDSGYSWDFA